MTPDPREVIAMARERRSAMADACASWDRLALARQGKYAELYPQDFDRNRGPRVATMLGRSWRMFARRTGIVSRV